MAIVTAGSEYLALSALSTPLLLLPRLLAMILLAVLSLLSVAKFITLPFSRLRNAPVAQQVHSLIGVFAYAVILGFGFFSTPLIRDAQLRAFSERSAPLIEAIAAYTSSNGAPPETLEQLVPDFLPEVPATGMGAYQASRHQRLERDASHCLPVSGSIGSRNHARARRSF